MKKIMIICVTMMAMIMTIKANAAESNIAVDTEILTVVAETEEPDGCFESAGRKIDEGVEYVWSSVKTAGMELSETATMAVTKIKDGACYVSETIKAGTGYAIGGIGTGIDWLTTKINKASTWLISTGEELKG